MKVLCFVIHGIGTQNQDFADPLERGVHRELTKLLRQKQSGTGAEKWTGIEPASLVDFKPLYWADIGSAEQKELYKRIYPELFGTEKWYAKCWQFWTQLRPARSLAINLIGDIFSYLGTFHDQIKRKVFDQVANKLTDIASKERFSVILIGHSLGTVILHDLVSACIRYRYAGFESLAGRMSVITMGSPISLFSLMADTGDLKQFHKWINFLHPHDPIAMPMEGVFPNAHDKELFRLTRKPHAAHSVYWHRRSVHKSIAEEIVEHVEKDLMTTSLAKLPGDPPPEIFQPFNKASARSGFSAYIPDFHGIPFGHLIPKAKQIDICQVYGGHWIDGNASYFVDFLCNPDAVLNICLLSPKSSALPGFCHHFTDMAPDLIKNKIKGGTDGLIKAWRQAQSRVAKTGRLKIYHALNIVNHSFYRIDDIIYFTPRPVASDKLAAKPVSLVYRNTNQDDDFYSWLIEDFRRVIGTKHDAELAFDSDNPPALVEKESV